MVRVSRRVGWRADPRRRRPRVPNAGARTLRSSPAGSRHCEQYRQLGRAAKARRPAPEGGHGRSSVAGRAARPGSFNAPGVSPGRKLLPGVEAARQPVAALRPRKVRRSRSAEAGAGPEGSEHPASPSRRPVEFRGPNLRFHPLAPRRFHVLLNSLFKVLFNFPSRYLSAIGLVPVFSLRWSLPPALGCIPKQPDSGDAQRHRPPCR